MGDFLTRSETIFFSDTKGLPAFWGAWSSSRAAKTSFIRGRSLGSTHKHCKARVAAA